MDWNRSQPAVSQMPMATSPSSLATRLQQKEAPMVAWYLSALMS